MTTRKNQLRGAFFRRYGIQLLILLIVGATSVRFALMAEHEEDEHLWSVDLASRPGYPSVASNLQPQLPSVLPLKPFPGYAGVKPVVGADHLGNVVIACQAMPSSPNAPLHSEIVYWRSVDRGLVWSTPRALTGQPSKGFSLHADPWLETDRRGRFYLVYARVTSPGPDARDYTPVIRRARDGGDSWSPPIAVGKTDADRPVLGVSPDGTCLIVATATGQVAGEGHYEHATGVFVSTDFGRNWERYPDPLRGVHAVPFSAAIDNAGRIATGWIVRGNGSQSVICTISGEPGRWSETTLVASLQPDRSHPFSGGRYAVLGVDGESTLHAAFVNAGAKALMVSKTSDWERWSEPRRLSDTSADECRNAAIDVWGPRVHVAWMERRGGSEHGSHWNTYYSVSGDYGQTWSTPLHLAGHPVTADYAVLPDEQISVVDDGWGRVHVAWAVRNGLVLHARIPLPAATPKAP